MAVLIAPKTPSAPQMRAMVPATPNRHARGAERIQLFGDEVELPGKVLEDEVEHGRAIRSSAVTLPSTASANIENGKSDNSA